MLRRLLVLAAAVASLSTPGVRSAKLETDGGFLPENDWKIPVESADAKGLNEAQFNEVITAVSAVYAPIVAAHGGKLVVERNWTDATVNAYATRSGGAWNVHMFGGLARHAAVTQDGFALVVCHELGHHLAGFPKKNGFGWASNEGQSDYFAPTKCLRRVFASSKAGEFTRPRIQDAATVAACAKAWSGSSDRALCERSALAGLSIGTLFKELRNETKPPSFDTPDPARVAQMMDAHPGTQCRLDTYLQGALCGKPLAEDFNDSNANPGACTRSQGFTAGLRPRCWFKPPAGEPDPALLSAHVADRARESFSKGEAFKVLERGL